MSKSIEDIFQDAKTEVESPSQLKQTLRSNIRKLFSSKSKSDIPSLECEEVIERPQVDLFYEIDEIPPWHLCLLYSIDIVSLAVAVTLPVYFILLDHLCADVARPIRIQLLQASVLMAGMTTFVQVLVGTRMPMLSASSIFFLPGILSVLDLNPSEHCTSDTTTFSRLSEKEQDEIILERLAYVRGAIIMSGVVQAFMGVTGLAAALARHTSLITMASCIIVSGFSLRQDAVKWSSGNWPLTFGCIFVTTFFFQYLRLVEFPVSGMTRRGHKVSRQRLIQKFAVMLTLIVIWAICGMFRIGLNHENLNMIATSSWYSPPVLDPWRPPLYDGKQLVFVIPSMLINMVNSVLDCQQGAELVDAPNPPAHSINRSSLIDGIMNMISGAVGAGTGMGTVTVYLTLLEIAKVASRFVPCLGAVLLIISSFSGKTMAIVAATPYSLIGAFMIMLFGVMSMVGMIFCTQINLASPRNVFVLGITTYMALMTQEWMNSLRHGNGGKGSAALNTEFTGNPLWDNFIVASCSNGVFIAFVLGWILDIVVPGDKEDRGMVRWRQEFSETYDTCSQLVKYQKSRTYDFPLITPLLNMVPCCMYMPLCPPYRPSKMSKMFSVAFWVKALFGVDLHKKRMRPRTHTHVEQTLRELRVSRMSLSQVVMEDTLTI